MRDINATRPLDPDKIDSTYFHLLLLTKNLEGGGINERTKAMSRNRFTQFYVAARNTDGKHTHAHT